MTIRRVIKTAAILIGILLLIVLGYVAYVFLSFHRQPDELALQAETTAGDVLPSVPVGEELTIVSYNIGFGAYSDDFTFFMDGGKESRARSEEAVYENIGGAMQTVTEQDPDIALIQEVDIDGTRSHHIDERTIVVPAMAEAGAYEYTFAQNYDSPYLMYPLTQPHGANQAGILSFSKYHITGAERRSLPIENGFSKVLDLDRCYAKMRIPAGEKELIVYNLHLSAYTANADTAEKQLDMLIKDMQAEYDAGNYCIAGGDFNRDLLGNSPEIFGTATLADNWAQPVNMDLFTDDILLEAPFDETDMAASCRNPDKPYEPGDFVVTVDGFIRSSNVEVTKSAVIDTGYRYSDHNPVYMKVYLKK